MSFKSFYDYADMGEMMSKLKLENNLKEKTVNVKSKSSKIDIPIGTSGKLSDFTDIYSHSFLWNKGLRIRSYNRNLVFDGPHQTDLKLVKLDGLTVVGDANTIFTYLGNSHWQVGVKK